MRLGWLTLAVATLAGYDAWGYRGALAFEREDNPAPAVKRRWEEFLAWHPSQPLFWPGAAKQEGVVAFVQRIVIQEGA